MGGKSFRNLVHVATAGRGGTENRRGFQNAMGYVGKDWCACVCDTMEGIVVYCTSFDFNVKVYRWFGVATSCRNN